MQYISTRGKAPSLNFEDVLLCGLANDGGLYIPETFPQISLNELITYRGQPYCELAKFILRPFIGDRLPLADFERLIDESYKTFHHPAICPIVQTGSNEFILELFHGPTLAFKDLAMQLLGTFMDFFLQNKKYKTTIIGATSGDTGSAAIEAFAGRTSCDVFILFPYGKVSEIQQKQMTTSQAKNVHALAIEGNFDDCQSLVKAMFNDTNFRNQFHLSGVNSINWARIMGQIVYYFYAALALGGPERKISFTVPTGNFGDIFAGFVAYKMGLPIEHLCIATNDNDILVRALNHGEYAINHLIHTISPSMDIQISSNFERLLFEYSHRDSHWINNIMNQLTHDKKFHLPASMRQEIQKLFYAGMAHQDETYQMMETLYKATGYLADPHTAIGIKVARDYQRQLKQTSTPMVVLSTAHPAKFPEAVKKSTQIKPILPAFTQDILDKPEKYTVLPADLSAIQTYIRTQSTLSTAS